jgi:NAD(P)-dependent dehydrogenase (short-subunit alcohol dehydrogenase family)
VTEIKGRTAVVTGGQRGLGKQLAAELLARGAAKVYVTARTPVESDDPRLIPFAADITDPISVAALAVAAADATLVVNNAGVWSPTLYLDDVDLSDAITLFATNYFGSLRVIQAFTPILKANGGGAFVVINSVAAWAAGQDAYNASKAALWSATNSMRVHLREQGTQVLGVYVGPIDTEMSRPLEVVKSPPELVAKAALDALEDGQSEVLVDDATRAVKAALSGPVEGLTFDL